MNSLGVIETRGLTAAIHAADAACKAASVEIIGYRKIGSGLVSICFQGEISAVRAAIDSGIAVVRPAELVVGSLVIARPEPNVIKRLEIMDKKKFFHQEATEVSKDKALAPLVDISAEPAIKVEQNPVSVSMVEDSATKEAKTEARKGKK
nr:BMC domain-containing protein [uncultured Moellerella sp.]